jgi:hypothetical protein
MCFAATEEDASVARSVEDANQARSPIQAPNCSKIKRADVSGT